MGWFDVHFLARGFLKPEPVVGRAADRVSEDTIGFAQPQKPFRRPRVVGISIGMPLEG